MKGNWISLKYSLIFIMICHVYASLQRSMGSLIQPYPSLIHHDVGGPIAPAPLNRSIHTNTFYSYQFAHKRCLILYKKQTTNFSFSLLNKNMDYNHTFYLINITWSEVQVWYCTQTVIQKLLKLLTCIWDKIWLDAVDNGFSTSLNWKSPIFHHNIYIYC